jgi:hypothetical protein
VERINFAQVLSATKTKTREALGERVTAWLRSHPNDMIESAVVRQSSDAEFHCLTIVLFGRDPDLPTT